jgi:hypothetical protein
MSHSINKHRAAKALRHAEHAQSILDDVSIYGAASDDALTWTDRLSMIAKGTGEIASSALKSKEEKAAAEARAKAAPAAKTAREKADAKSTEARYARMEADATEKEAFGPKHQHAQRLTDEAAKLDGDARDLEAKAGMTSPLAPGAMMPGGGSGAFPSWVKWAALGVGGVTVLGLGMAFLLKGKK